ncbi:MAG: hypothetical protein ACXWCZ_00245 [Flavisolibacter sp.]
MTRIFTLLLAVIVLASGCKTASKSYQKGDYTEAIDRGIKKLQKDPDDYETRDLVKNSYTYTVNEYEDQIRTLSNSKSENRFEKIYYNYNLLQNLYVKIRQSPSAAQYVKPKDYSEYVETYREKAADVYIADAEKWKNVGTKVAYREAYNAYNAALRLRPEDFDLKRDRDSAYESAVTKVVVTEMQNFGQYSYSSSYQMQNFQRDVIRTLSHNMNNDFVKFYNESEARMRDIIPDHVMELNLSRITLGQPYDNKSTREVSKEVVVKEIVYKPDSVVKQYGKVNAKITTTKRQVLSHGDLIIAVRDTKGRTLWNDRFTGEHKWNTEYASYTGDERALSESDKELVNRNNNYNPPTEEQIMEELLRQIQNDLTYRLRNYYARMR